MIDVTLKIVKKLVYEEVAKTTNYTGNKQMDEDNKAYNRVATTDSDSLMLERFFNECCDEATDHLKPFITSVTSPAISNGLNLDSNYEVELSLSSSYDTSLNESMNSNLFSFFVAGIVSKWFQVSNKKEAAEYAAEANNMMNIVMQKVYYRKKPTRQIPH